MSCHCHPSPFDTGDDGGIVDSHERTISQMVDRELGYDDDELEGLVCSPSPELRRSLRRPPPTLWQRLCATVCAWVPREFLEKRRGDKASEKGKRRRKSTPSPLRAHTPPQEVNFLVSKTSLADYSWLQEKEDAEFVARVRSHLIKKGSMLSLH